MDAAKTDETLAMLKAKVAWYEQALKRTRKALREALADGIMLADHGWPWPQNGALGPLDWLEVRERLLTTRNRFFPRGGSFV